VLWQTIVVLFGCCVALLFCCCGCLCFCFLVLTANWVPLPQLQSPVPRVFPRITLDWLLSPCNHIQVGAGKPLPLQTQINSEHLVALWSSKWLAGRRRNWGPALSLTTSNRKGAEARTRQNTKYKIQNPSPSGNPWP